MGEEDVDHATKEKEAAKAMAELLAQEEKAGGAKVRTPHTHSELQCSRSGDTLSCRHWSARFPTC
jgi:hypothetical protein